MYIYIYINCSVLYSIDERVLLNGYNSDFLVCMGDASGGDGGRGDIGGGGCRVVMLVVVVMVVEVTLVVVVVE